MPTLVIDPECLVEDTTTTTGSQSCMMHRLGVWHTDVNGEHVQNTNEHCPNPAKLRVIIHNGCDGDVPSCPDCYAQFRKLCKRLVKFQGATCKRPLTWADVRSEKL